MSYKPAIVSMSLGRCFAGHTLATKFQAARDAGIAGVEMFYEDLVDLASTLPSHPGPNSLLDAAEIVHGLSVQHSLPIIGLGPFGHYEGLLSPTARAAKMEELHLWFQICRILETDLIQIPSTFNPASENTSDFTTIVRDMQEVADIGAIEGFRFAFENLCFGTHIDTWSQAWAVVKAVDRENFGLCLDTFNIAGREFADPSAPGGKVPNAEVSFKHSMARMVKEIDVNKVFYIQVVDAEKLETPLDENHAFYVEGMKARMCWSRNCRLFLGETERGGYLPVLDVVKAICNGLGYRGWVSMELFNRTLVKEDREVPIEHAKRAMKSWSWICKQMGWDVTFGVKEKKAEKGREPEITTDVWARL